MGACDFSASTWSSAEDGKDKIGIVDRIGNRLGERAAERFEQLAMAQSR